MSGTETAPQAGATAGVAVQPTSDFASLLTQEFKPKSDQAQVGSRAGGADAGAAGAGQHRR